MGFLPYIYIITKTDRQMKLDLEKLGNESRVQDCNETLKVISHNKVTFWSWGAHAFKNYQNKVLRFKVNGHHHKGHVYVAVNGSDLYDVYLTTTRGNIVKDMKDIYFDEIQDRIDNAIERIGEYEI